MAVCKVITGDAKQGHLITVVGLALLYFARLTRAPSCHIVITGVKHTVLIFVITYIYLPILQAASIGYVSQYMTILQHWQDGHRDLVMDIYRGYFIFWTAVIIMIKGLGDLNTEVILGFLHLKPDLNPN